MSRLPRVLSTLAATAGVCAGMSVGVSPIAHAATPQPEDGLVKAVVTATTTRDINVKAVASDSTIERLVDRAESGPVRLAGADRYATSVLISKRAFPTSAKTVYLVGGTRTDEALAAGSLTDGPVLLVPTTGDVPRSVLSEIARLSPSRVVALGGSASVSAATLTTAAQGLPTSRIGSNDVYETTTAIARRAFPSGAEKVYLAQVGGSADAVSGGSLSDGPVVPVPATGTAPAAVRNLVATLSPHQVVGLGGTGAISQATVTSAAGGHPTSRLAGVDRYETGRKVAQAAFPDGSNVAYLAGSHLFADAVAGGTLRDGPVLLTPPASATTYLSKVSGTLNALGVRHVGTLGGTGAVSDASVTKVAAKVPTATTTSLPGYVVPAPTAPPPPAPEPTPVAVPEPTSGSSETCASVIKSFTPIPRDSRYTISCVSGFDTAQTLGTTETWLDGNTGEFVGGKVEIRSDLTGNVLRAVIAHELAHAWSYSEMTSAKRQQFATYTGVSSWGGGDYNSMPAEVWARTQATCVGWPDGYGRKQLTCPELEPFGWR